MSIGLLLSLIFMTLKLVGCLDWSWFLVWLPTIVEVAIVWLVILLALAGMWKRT